MAKIRCKFCQFERDGKCVKKKNATVKLNKKRRCVKFSGDAIKIDSYFEKRETIPTIFRPDWFWNKALKSKTTDFEQYGAAKVSSHPLTGNLDKFIK